MSSGWLISEASGAEIGLLVTLTEDEPTASLTVTMCDGPAYDEDRPTFCVCWPAGQSPPNGATIADLPDALIPEVVIEEGVVTVAFDRVEFTGNNWPDRWNFSVIHEQDGGDPAEPPPLILLASGYVVLPDDPPASVVCNVEVS